MKKKAVEEFKPDPYIATVLTSKVIKTRSVKYTANFLKLDIYTPISNGLGAISGLVQLVLYGRYHRINASEDENAKQTELQIPAPGHQSATQVKRN